jgi:hypothetical protein
MYLSINVCIYLSIYLAKAMLQRWKGSRATATLTKANTKIMKKIK